MGLIRLLLALSVFVVHSEPIFGVKLLNGTTAVEGFFLLSGFYMALIMHKYSPITFYQTRIKRLYPAYFIILIVGIVVALFGARWELNLVSWVVLGFSNLTMIGLDVLSFFGVKDGALYLTGAFTPAHQYFVLSPAWTLGIEIWFYLLAPFLVKRKWYVILGLLLLSVGARLLASRFGLSGDPWNYRYFPFEYALFLGGILSYKLYATISIQKNYGWIALVAVVMATMFSLNGLPYYILLAFCIPFIFTLSKNWKWDRFIGELTYPFYLMHALALSFHFNQIVTLVVCLALSVPIVLYVERPFRQ